MKSIPPIAFVCLAVLTGCSKRSENSAAAAPNSVPTEVSTPVVHDPVSDLKSAINYIRERDPNGKWDHAEYDVSKTSSLVSPYMGTIVVDLVKEYGTGGRDVGFGFGKRGTCDCKITLAYQANRWVVKGVRNTYHNVDLNPTHEAYIAVKGYFDVATY